MASKPSERHVFFVDDLDAVKKIEEQLITFVCEAATASEFPVRCTEITDCLVNMPED